MPLAGSRAGQTRCSLLDAATWRSNSPTISGTTAQWKEKDHVPNHVIDAGSAR